MVGYGPEDKHFVVELTYNYGIGTYKLGNDFMVIFVTNVTILSYIKTFCFWLDTYKLAGKRFAVYQPLEA